jgi:hypothetical protein
MNSRLDELLESAGFEPPEGFVHRVIDRLNDMPPIRKVRGIPGWLPWVAVICGAALGLDELASFMLSAWIAVAAN